jgi:hypothetical protein
MLRPTCPALDVRAGLAAQVTERPEAPVLAISPNGKTVVAGAPIATVGVDDAVDPDPRSARVGQDKPDRATPSCSHGDRTHPKAGAQAFEPRVLNGYGSYRLVAVAQDVKNGITMWTSTDQPLVQLYTGNFLVGDLIGTSGNAYRQGDAFTLETLPPGDDRHAPVESEPLAQRAHGCAGRAANGWRCLTKWRSSATAYSS